MIKQLTQLYNKINPLWGLGGITVVVVFAIIKGTIWYDHRNDKIEKKDLRNEQWIKRDSINHFQIDKFMTIVISKLNNQSDSIRTINRGVRSSKRVLFNLQDYMQKNVATKDELLEIQQIFNDKINEDEKKKNDWIQSGTQE